MDFRTQFIIRKRKISKARGESSGEHPNVSAKHKKVRDTNCFQKPWVMCGVAMTDVSLSSVSIR